MKKKHCAKYRDAHFVELRRLQEQGGGDWSWEILREAVFGGATEFVEYLVRECNYKINETDARGRTLLFEAVERGDARAVALLLKFDAKIKITDGAGVSPASLAQKLGFAEITDLIRAKSIKNQQPEINQSETK